MNTSNTNPQGNSTNIQGKTHQQAKLEVTSHEARRLAKQAISKALQTANSHLIPAGDKPLISASKNIRIELKRLFPKTKFSVTTDRFAGGDAIRIRWVDGPTTEAVEQVSHKYEAGSFDGSCDLYTYNDTQWTEAFGDAKYITTTRDFSDSTITATIEELAAEFHDGDKPTVEDFKQGRLFYSTPSRHAESWSTLIRQTMWVKSL